MAFRDRSRSRGSACVNRMLGTHGLCTCTPATASSLVSQLRIANKNGPVHLQRQGGTGCDVLLLVWFMLLGADGCRWPLAAVSGCRAPGAVCALPVAGHRADTFPCRGRRIGHASPAAAHRAYGVSFPVKRISTFWSHSWRGAAWQKIMVLQLIYNGLPAAVLGSCAAACGLALTLSDILPTTSGQNQYVM